MPQQRDQHLTDPARGHAPDRRALLRPAVAALAALALAACGGEPAREVAEPGGAEGEAAAPGAGVETVLRIGASDAFTSGNPFNLTSLTDARIRSYVHPFLVSYAPSGELVGNLAEDWSVSDDGRTYTFDTVTGARWSDSEPLTARDAAYTIELILRYREGPTARRAHTVAGVESAEAVDDDTLVVTYAEPSPSALDALTSMPVLAEHVWSEVEGSDGSALTTFSNTEPMVAGGPFVLREARSEVSVFDRNEHWYGPMPSFSTLAVSLFSNPDAMVNALRRDEIDMAVGLPPTALRAVRDHPDIVVDEVEGSTYQYMYVNADPERADRRYLLDPDFRRGVGHAIDREAIAETAFDGALTPNPSVIGPFAGDWHDPDVEQPFDLDLADDILTEAGYPLGDDGRRQSDEGPISFEIFTVSTNTGGTRTYEVIARSLEAIGISTTQRVLDPAGANEYGNFQVGIFNNSSTRDPSNVLSTFVCPPGAGFNPTNFCDPEFDRAFEQQAGELDAERRRQLAHELQHWLVDNGPVWVLGYERGHVIHRAEWTGFEGYPDAAFSFWAPYGLLGGERAG